MFWADLGPPHKFELREPYRPIQSAAQNVAQELDCGAENARPESRLSVHHVFERSSFETAFERMPRLCRRFSASQSAA